MIEVPVHKRKHTLMAIGYGALLMAWLSLEDSTLVVVSALGAGLALMIVSLAMMRWFGGRPLPARYRFASFVAFGTLVGFSAVWTTVTLMVFKNAWHAHAALDFPSDVVVGVMERVIPWTIAGALLGGAFGLLSR